MIETDRSSRVPLNDSSGAVTATVEPYVVEVAVRWSDQDALNHVNHAVVVELMAEARMLWLARDAVVSGYEDFRQAKMVASMSIDYYAPVEYGAPLSVAMSVCRIGTKSYTLRHVGSQGAQACFRGTVVIVPRDVESARARPVTAAERAYLERFLLTDVE